MEKPAQPIGVKLIALLLILGGAAGVVFGLVGEAQALMNFGVGAAAWVGVFVLLFGWGAWIGYELCRGKPWAFRWARIIMAAQIPNFTFPGFSFDGFFTGLRVYFMVSDQPPNLRWGFNLSSAIHFMISANIDFWLFGVNFVAILAVAHLTRAARQRKLKQSDPEGGQISGSP